jgi:hypothetical protein
VQVYPQNVYLQCQEGEMINTKLSISENVFIALGSGKITLQHGKHKKNKIMKVKLMNMTLFCCVSMQ